MSLGAPWMLLLLPLVVLAGWLMARCRRLQREAACRLKGVAAEDGPGGLTRRDWLTLAALVCVVVALARPQWNPRPYDIERRGRDLVIALDVSRSMLAADIFPNRLEMARIAIHEALPALTGQRVALVTFAGSASVRVPLTLDHGFVRYMLERADPSDMDVGSTSLQAAFEKVASTVLTDAAGGRRDLVVFTDGEDHLSDLGKTAELLAQCGARVLIVGLGDPVRGARVPDARRRRSMDASQQRRGGFAAGREYAFRTRRRLFECDVLSGAYPSLRPCASLPAIDCRRGRRRCRGRTAASALHGRIPLSVGFGRGAVVGFVAIETAEHAQPDLAGPVGARLCSASRGRW